MSSVDRRSGASLFCAVVAATLGSVGAALAQPAPDKGQVTLSFRVPPTARMELPAGAEFVLHVPPDLAEGPVDADAPGPGTAEIPFSISGNAVVTVLIEPGSVLRYEADGAVGRAFHLERPDLSLPYRLRLEYPKGHLRAPQEGPGHPGVNNPVTGGSYSIDSVGGPVTGVVQVIPDAPPGRPLSSQVDAAGYYRGVVEFTVIAEPD